MDRSEGTQARGATRARAVSELLSEQQIQRTLVAHLTARPAADLWWCHVPNGGFRTRTEGAILNGLGLRKGAPDLLLICDGKAYGLELKRLGGKPSHDQIECLAAMERAGAATAVAVGLDRALHQLESWRLLRGRGAA
jgi:hypothetical protein